MIFDTKIEFEEIFRTHYSELCSYAFNFTKDLDDAEEVVQDIFVKLWDNKKNIDVKTSIKSYLYSSVRNRCLNTIKHIEIREKYKEFNKQEIELDENLQENESEKTEMEQKLRNLIDNLPEKRRRIFIMSRYNGLKYKEIAEELSISIKTVENQMGKAMKFLRQELTELSVIIFFVIEILNF